MKFFHGNQSIFLADKLIILQTCMSNYIPPPPFELHSICQTKWHKLSDMESEIQSISRWI